MTTENPTPNDHRQALQQILRTARAPHLNPFTLVPGPTAAAAIEWALDQTQEPAPPPRGWSARLPDPEACIKVIEEWADPRSEAMLALALRWALPILRRAANLTQNGPNQKPDPEKPADKRTPDHRMALTGFLDDQTLDEEAKEAVRWALSMLPDQPAATSDPEKPVGTPLPKSFPILTRWLDLCNAPAEWVTILQGNSPPQNVTPYDIVPTIDLKAEILAATGPNPEPEDRYLQTPLDVEPMTLENCLLSFRVLAHHPNIQNRHRRALKWAMDRLVETKSGANLEMPHPADFRRDWRDPAMFTTEAIAVLEAALEAATLQEAGVEMPCKPQETKRIRIALEWALSIIKRDGSMISIPIEQQAPVSPVDDRTRIETLFSLADWMEIPKGPAPKYAASAVRWVLSKLPDPELSPASQAWAGALVALTKRELRFWKEAGEVSGNVTRRAASRAIRGLEQILKTIPADRREG